ncbi:DUF5819 family protein [Streptomyces sp. NPDC002769]|uniref:DUF5819 family protein n=1 Tax=Streptomyces sp. NPDC002769 TaxID=3154542 RepID=UPI00332B79A3
MRKTGWAVSSGIEPADVKELPHSDSGPAAQECPDDVPTPAKTSKRARVLKAGLSAAVVLCVATTLVHVVLVFLHVAPANTVSKRYNPLINAWVYPFFEQNWRLFAPDPESVNRQILARTARSGTGKSVHVSSWFDLTAVDNSAVEHDPFPSHTAQNLLRRSWTSYVESHGGDDRAHTERALMMQKYLSNIAADRMAAHNGGTFDFIQLRVVTRPIAAPGSPVGSRPPAPTENRLLPWWKVTPHGN